jgi:predicted LPLAT superfamily acyltransferase
MNTQWLAQSERSNILAMRFLVWTATTLGRRVARWLLYPICLYFLACSMRARRASRRYLHRVLGRPAGWREVFHHYFTFAAVNLDRVFLLRGRYELFDIHAYGEQPVFERITRNEGTFVFGAHIGSFEVPRAMLHQPKNIKVRMLMFEENARKLNSVLSAIDPSFPLNVIAMGKLDSMLKISECLDAGEFVGILGDRAPKEAGHVSLPFLGDPAEFPIAPFRLAAMLRKPVFLMIGLYRGGNRYDLHFEQLANGEPVERNDRDRTIQAWQRRYVERLEYYCRLAPYNWFNFYDFWQTHP